MPKRGPVSGSSQHAIDAPPIFCSFTAGFEVSPSGQVNKKAAMEPRYSP